MISILLFLFGTHELEISGISMERCLNLCAKQGIVLTNLVPVDGGYRFSIKRKAYEDLIDICKKTNTKMKVIGRHGLPFFFEKYRMRKMFFFGFFLCIVGIIAMSQFIWKITLVGVESYSKESIERYVAKEGCKIGKLKGQIDCNNLEEKIREKYSKIAWVSCSISGTRLKIELKESLDQSTKQNVKRPCDIVSNRTGTVCYIAVKSGTPLIHIGMKVKKGDTLISGLIYYYSDDFQVTQTDRIKADGKICLKTKELYYESIPKVSYEKSYTNIAHQITMIKIGSLHISLPIKKDSRNYDIMEEEKTLKVWGDFYFPISVKVQTKKLYRIKKEKRTNGKGRKILEARFRIYKQKLRKKGIKILKEKTKYKFKDEKIEMKGYILVEEPVGVIRNIRGLTKKQEKYITPTTATPK